MNQSQSPQEYFRLILLTVIGQALHAAGYELQDRPVQWAGGLFRFAKRFDGGLYGFIEFQLLSYIDTLWASGNPSRFHVTFVRSDQPTPDAPSRHPRFARRSLSALVVEDFGVAILPDADHWWEFRTTQQLGSALAEAGHLIVGYGLPWLAGDLAPPSG
ncbi:MAG: hypothetical protein HZC41_15925 [Chloroflexi bacterium]|nr:hypothetical protein [Chloroflexota bacterium]